MIFVKAYVCVLCMTLYISGSMPTSVSGHRGVVSLKYSFIFTRVCTLLMSSAPCLNVVTRLKVNFLNLTGVGLPRSLLSDPVCIDQCQLGLCDCYLVIGTWSSKSSMWIPFV